MYKDFNSQEEVDQYLSEIGNHWGRQQEEIVIIQNEIQDEQGNVVEPQITETLPQQVVFTTEDISAQVTKDLEISQRKMVREECLKIVDEIAAYNVQVAQNLQGIFSSSGFIQIILALNTGAAKSAATGMRALGPQVYPQQLVEEFAAKLEAL